MEKASNITKEEKMQKGICGSTLKLIAIVTMLIDHIGAAICGRYLLIAGFGNIALYDTYRTMRMIGRVAFPIFCFLLVEGFQKTGNAKKYATRLGVFAVISEIPFDLAFKSSMIEFSYQNVYFTLFIGLLTMIGVDRICRTCFQKEMQIVLSVAIVCAGAGLAELLRTDYGATGVFCIMLLYVFRKKRLHQIVAGCIAFAGKSTAPLAFIPIAFYNGKRGLSLKYVFYAFYPVHLVVLFLICMMLGIAGYPAV